VFYNGATYHDNIFIIWDEGVFVDVGVGGVFLLDEFLSELTRIQMHGGL
jgi:hypothetical protein